MNTVTTGIFHSSLHSSRDHGGKNGGMNGDKPATNGDTAIAMSDLELKEKANEEAATTPEPEKPAEKPAEEPAKAAEEP